MGNMKNEKCITAQDCITVRDISFYGYHGVLPEERQKGQEFLTTVKIYTDMRRAAETDDLQEAVDYSQAVETVQEIITGSPVNLLETLAGRIAAGLTEIPGVAEAEVEVSKPRPPLAAVTGRAGVSIRRRRTEESTNKMSPAKLATAYIGLGSNLQDRLAYLNKAVELLQENGNIKITALSSIYETDPVGGPLQSRYLNSVAEIETNLAPEQLLQVTKDIENKLGRTREEHWGPRFIDLDILTFGNITRDTDTLQLPHPLIKERWFVLVPLCEIAPHLIPPGYDEPVSELLKKLGTPRGIDKIGCHLIC